MRVDLTLWRNIWGKKYFEVTFRSDSPKSGCPMKDLIKSYHLTKLFSKSDIFEEVVIQKVARQIGSQRDFVATTPPRHQTLEPQIWVAKLWV